MDFDYFEQAGALLFGDNWIIPAARALGVNRRTIYKWKVLGEVPESNVPRLRELVAERKAALGEFERGLRSGRRRPIQR